MPCWLSKFFDEFEQVTWCLLKLTNELRESPI